MNVIITGSNRGIGKAMVKAFAATGANIWACARQTNQEFESWLKEIAYGSNLYILSWPMKIQPILASNLSLIVDIP